MTSKPPKVEQSEIELAKRLTDAARHMRRPATCGRIEAFEKLAQALATAV